MAFWGVELKPGKPYTHNYDETRGRLRVTQATLGNVVGAKAGKPAAAKTTVQCNVGEKSPVLICSLFSDACETCRMELEFEEQEEVVFSVLGLRSVHLSGYYVGSRDGSVEPYGEDIAETESEDSDYNALSDEDEYESDFIDDGDDLEMYDDDIYSPSHPRKSGVVIEEIFDEEAPSNGDLSRLGKKKNRQVSDSDDAAGEPKRQLRIISASSVQPDSEDEDGFPISESKKSEEAKEVTKKRKSDDLVPVVDEKMGEDNDVSKKKKKKLDKKNKKKEKDGKGSLSGVTAEDVAEENAPIDGEKPKEDAKVGAVQELTPASKKITEVSENGQSADASEKESKKKKKKKNKNKQSGEKDQGKKEEEEKDKEPQQSRTFGNGLVVEELSMGRPKGKKATPGTKVSVNYIGKLQNGTIFDSNIGQRPFRFRLGIGQVIKGWDVGVSGMRVGDKRRLTIPPAMGYGDKAAGKIPKNSWLIFDVELVDVQ